jgi:hypothetical protein
MAEVEEKVKVVLGIGVDKDAAPEGGETAEA